MGKEVLFPAQIGGFACNPRQGGLVEAWHELPSAHRT